MNVRPIQLRRGTAAAWTAANPTLAEGEAGIELDTNKLKFGDGITAWNSLSYFSPGGGGDDVVLAEIPSGAIDGSNKDFTTSANYSKLWVYLNGTRQNPNSGGDYSETGANSFQMTTAPESGDDIIVDYIPS